MGGRPRRRKELAQLDPDNPDPGGIVSDARAKIRDAQLAERYAQARNHSIRRIGNKPPTCSRAIKQEQPGYPDVAGLSRPPNDSASWLHGQSGSRRRRTDDWDALVAALENICAIDPAYRDAGARLQQARSAKRHRSLVEEVTALHQAGRWNEGRGRRKGTGPAGP